MSPSDKRALIILGSFFFVMVCYFGIGKTFGYRADAQVELMEERQLKWWVKTYAPVVVGGGGEASGALEDLDQSLLNVASNSAKTFSLKFKRFQPEKDTMLRVWMEEVNFNDLMKWLDSVEKANGIRVHRVTVERKDKPGIVDVNLTLERPISG